LGGAEVELGLGIHGEPGAAVMALPPARELVDTMMQRLVAYKGEGRLQKTYSDMVMCAADVVVA
jgi:dihydroxyacetone kinase